VRGYFVKAESIEETTKWYRNGHKNAGIGYTFDDLEEEYAERHKLKVSKPAVEFLELLLGNQPIFIGGRPLRLWKRKGVDFVSAGILDQRESIIILTPLSGE
jgi:hypothetical protein